MAPVDELIAASPDELPTARPGLRAIAIGAGQAVLALPISATRFAWNFVAYRMSRLRRNAENRTAETRDRARRTVRAWTGR